MCITSAVVFKLVTTILSCTGTITSGANEYSDINPFSVSATFLMYVDTAPGFKCFGIDASRVTRKRTKVLTVESSPAA